ncbi:MAG: hypothetical protein U0414_18445 [Polyangiaceae bacterium]
MCTAVDQAKCTTSCEQNIQQALTCGPQFVAYFECVTQAFPAATCSCDMGSVACPDLCTKEYDDANTCLFML